MKWIGSIVSFFLHGIGISFTVKFLFENILGITMASNEFSLLNQFLFFFIGGFCGLSFIWLTVDFAKEWQRFAVIFINYFLVINISFSYLIYKNVSTFEELIQQNILWMTVFIIIYVSIVIYQKVLANQLTKKLGSTQFK